MAEKTHPPSINKTSFNCPHCGTYTTQYWFKIYSKQVSNENPIPYIPSAKFKEIVRQKEEYAPEQKEDALGWYDKMITGLVFLKKEEEMWPDSAVYNLYISRCYDCRKITVWVHDNIVFPPEKQGAQPNQDLNEDIIKDFEEARSIVGLSPRGAAALLRLCIQKLCVFLGEKGENIDNDIARLVKKGLNPLVQKSLDIVRVIGNESVHPGVIELSDDRDTANELFGLINSIAEQMITHPKNVQELYGKLPEKKRNAIEKRDGKANKE